MAIHRAVKTTLAIGTVFYCGLLGVTQPAFPATLVGDHCVTGTTNLGSFQGCYSGLAQCKPGYSACGKHCVDPATDINHCGACIAQCVATPPSQASCAAGACQTGFHPPASP